MMNWQPSEIEKITGGSFAIPCGAVTPHMHELKFTAGKISYNLTVFPDRENIWLRADIESTRADQATPQFEFCFHCDRIRAEEREDKTKSISFEFTDGNEEMDFRESARLVMEFLPNGQVYTWPVIGAADPYDDTLPDTNEPGG